MYRALIPLEYFCLAVGLEMFSQVESQFFQHFLCEKPGAWSVATDIRVIKEPVKEGGWGERQILAKHPENQDEVTSQCRRYYSFGKAPPRS